MNNKHPLILIVCFVIYRKYSHKITKDCMNVTKWFYDLFLSLKIYRITYMKYILFRQRRIGGRRYIFIRGQGQAEVYV